MGVAKWIMRGIPVAPYTKAGDPFKFDFGYRVGNTIKIFQAVSMKSSIDQAVLAGVALSGDCGRNRAERLRRSPSNCSHGG